MSNYTQIIKQLLWEQYHDPDTQTIVISTLNIKFIPIKAQQLLQSYSHVKSLTITNCDLRKLENFPILPHLIDLDLSSNSLQGTFNYLMPLKSLRYLNIAQNIISDYRVLEPLRRLGKLEVYLKDNPFTETPNWRNKIRNFSIIILKDPKTLGKAKQTEVKKEAVDSAEKEQNEQERKKQPNRGMRGRPSRFGSYREKLMAGLQNNLESDFQYAPLPVEDIHFPNFHIEQVHPLEMPIPDNIVYDDVGSELNIEMDENNEELGLVVDEYASENFDDDDEEEGDDDPDVPYF